MEWCLRRRAVFWAGEAPDFVYPYSWWLREGIVGCLEMRSMGGGWPEIEKREGKEDIQFSWCWNWGNYCFDFELKCFASSAVLRVTVQPNLVMATLMFFNPLVGACKELVSAFLISSTWRHAFMQHRKMGNRMVKERVLQQDLREQGHVI